MATASNYLSFVFCILILLIETIKTYPPIIHYSHIMRILKIPYKTQPETIVYRIKASNADNQDINFDVVEDYGKHLIRFDKINQNEANVVLLCPLDKDSEYNLTIYARSNDDEATFIESRLIATDIDEIDSKEFGPFIVDQNPVYVFENVTLNNSIAIVKAYEQESSELPVTFELLDKNDNIFHFRYVFGPRGITIAEIILLKQLDYEQQNLYILTILALNGKTRHDVDTRNVHQTQLTIVVKDVQDTPPKFENLPQTIHIDDSYKPNQTFFIVDAHDGDITNKRDLIYSIRKPNDKFFAINSNGNISTPLTFDRLNELYDIRKPITLLIDANELVKQNSFTSLNSNNDYDQDKNSSSHLIIVLNTSNRKPYFSNENCVANIDEHSTSMTSVRWSDNRYPTIFDPDFGLNGTFEITITNDTTTFLISPKIGYRNSSFTLLVNDRNNSTNQLDYEQIHNLTVNVSVRDKSEEQPLSSSIVCIIHIIDINDNYPQFSENRYSSTLMENAPIGTTITKLSASDKDTGDFGQIRFTKINGPLAQNFQIDPFSGTIILIDNNDIDRENIEEIFLTIEAMDNNGNDGNRNMTELYIQILDVNDNPPLFLQPYYVTILKNDFSDFIHPLKVDAIDIDQINTTNSLVNYEILQGNLENIFDIDPQNGMIKIGKNDHISTTTINSLPNQINLTVRAYDFGIPQLSSSVIVFVYILNKPTQMSTLFSTNKLIDIRNGNSSLEKSLSLITGGNVTIKELRSPAQPNEPLKIVTIVRYGNENMIDLDNLDLAYKNLFNVPPSTLSSIPISIPKSTQIPFPHPSSNYSTILYPIITNKSIIIDHHHQQQSFISKTDTNESTDRRKHKSESSFSHRSDNDLDFDDNVDMNSNIHSSINDQQQLTNNDGQTESGGPPLVVRTSSTIDFLNFLIYFLLSLILMFLIFLCFLCCCCWNKNDSKSIFDLKNIWRLNTYSLTKNNSQKYHKRKRRTTSSMANESHLNNVNSNDNNQRKNIYNENKLISSNQKHQNYKKELMKQETILSTSNYDQQQQQNDDWFRRLEQKLQNHDDDLQLEIKEEKKYSSTPRSMSYCISKKIVKPKSYNQHQLYHEQTLSESNPSKQLKQIDILNLENGSQQFEHHRLFPSKKKNSILPFEMIQHHNQTQQSNLYQRSSNNQPSSTNHTKVMAKNQQTAEWKFATINKNESMTVNASNNNSLKICPKTTQQHRSIFSIAYDGIEHRENISSSESNQTYIVN